MDFHCIVHCISSNTRKHDATNSALFAAIDLRIVKVFAANNLQPYLFMLNFVDTFSHICILCMWHPFKKYTANLITIASTSIYVQSKN